MSRYKIDLHMLLNIDATNKLEASEFAGMLCRAVIDACKADEKRQETAIVGNYTRVSHIIRFNDENPISK